MAQSSASALSAEMSSLTAMQILPQSALKKAAPRSARHTSVREVPFSSVTMRTRKRPVSGSCRLTFLTPRRPSVWRK